MRAARLGIRSYTSTAGAVGAVDAWSSSYAWLHWSMGAAMIGCIGTVKAAQWTEGKSEEGKAKKGKLMRVHKSLALIVAALLPVRVVSRLATKAPKHIASSGALEKFAGNASHLALWGAMVGLPVSGISMGYFSGYGLPFFWTTIDGAAVPDKEKAGFAYKQHKWMGQAFTYLVPLHVFATGFHVFRGEQMLRRMSIFNKT